MNCEDFQTRLASEARDIEREAANEAQSAARVEACADCAEFERAARSLDAALRAIKREDAAKFAPAHLEENLLRAFRSERVTRPLAASNVVALADARERRETRNPLAWLRWATATVGVIAASLTLMFSLAPKPASVTKSTEPRVVMNGETLNATTDETVTNNAPTHERINKPNIQIIVSAGGKRHRMNASSDPHDSRISSRGEETAQPDAVSDEMRGDAEIATDFLPLGDPSFAATIENEGGQIVRVELPHSALAAFGIPTNGARAGERIKADVVIGADGRAQAIRFVR